MSGRKSSKPRTARGKGEHHGASRRERGGGVPATDEATARNVATGAADAQLHADVSLDELEAELERPPTGALGADRSPRLSGGDVDAAWDAADSGEETVGGSSPTPDQDRVDELGRAVGLTYSDTEPLHSTEKIERRDVDRWELDPASAEDYQIRIERERADEAARERSQAPPRRSR